MKGGSETASRSADDDESSQSTGVMGGFLSGAAALASKAVGSSPEATLELAAPPNQRLHFENGDEISGALSLLVPN